MTDTTAESARAAELRHKLADKLVSAGTITTKQVENAFRTVPRHLFAPEATLEAAYAQSIVATKKDEHGTTISSVSAPQIQAMMLEQAQLGPGMRTLEIGSGGYNAALMAELVDPGGEVTTLDIDPDVTERARTFLSEAGYDRVNVVTADGEQGDQAHAPFDRVLVTAGSWDIPPAWANQLTEDGILTVPLRMRGLTRSVAFVRQGDRLVSQSAKICGFVTMQGAGEHTERLLLLQDREIALRFDDEWPDDTHLLDGVLTTERAQAWSGVTIGRGETFDTLQLWLATALEGFCLLAVDPEFDTGVVTPQNRMACPAVVDTGNLAYLAIRNLDNDSGEPVFEFGAHAFGPQASTLAKTMSEAIQAWDRDHRGGPGPTITAHPVDIPDEDLPQGRVITKRHCRLTISWPPSASRAR
ncbi:methyltransferase, FxLD system [Nocardiopsis quinghaiensis]|uniref:methyltransferase, FxLD system n=1 Tax=Nocardiopsis quinghaiensis TaxID=464995 RepID=UPI0012388B2F|nr:methyltransferase, FxLD system [Nocardiopsis quinghaiensis]